MSRHRVAIIGGGVGGLAAAIELAGAGVDVVLLERAASVGGKVRETIIAGRGIDSGPTVLTMPWVFDAVFAAAGSSLAEHVTLRPAQLLARHAWDEHARLDLFADLEQTADAIATFAGAADAKGYRAFCAEAQRIHDTLAEPFIRASQPSLPGLIGRIGATRPAALLQLNPYQTLWRALGGYFSDQRLRQLFGRYATYCGSSPFEAPATLMLVAHVERQGVWLVDGGMQRLVEALAAVALARGAVIRCGCEVREIIVANGAVAGVALASGERIEAGRVIVNADSAALSAGRLGRAARRGLRPLPPARRSLSAVTYALEARTAGFPLTRHNVFFGGNYRDEFDAIFKQRRLPPEPTVYVCAQDRHDGESAGAGRAERLFCIVNAPPTGDTHHFSKSEIEQCEARTFRQLERCGLQLTKQSPPSVATPVDFERRFPGTGGALYGPVSHGWTAAFRRAGARGGIAGLYLAGGSVHPGAGMPMAALSGRQAAAALLRDLASTATLRGTATLGGISTPSAMTGGTD